jgi:hypothetical protein
VSGAPVLLVLQRLGVGRGRLPRGHGAHDYGGLAHRPCHAFVRLLTPPFWRPGLGPPFGISDIPRYIYPKDPAKAQREITRGTPLGSGGRPRHDPGRLAGASAGRGAAPGYHPASALAARTEPEELLAAGALPAGGPGQVMDRSSGCVSSKFAASKSRFRPKQATLTDKSYPGADAPHMKSKTWAVTGIVTVK